jgi:hypothetical protein
VRATKKRDRQAAAVRKMADVVARVYEDLNEAQHPVLDRGEELIIFQGGRVSERDSVVLSCIAEQFLGCKPQVVKEEIVAEMKIRERSRESPES